MRRVIWQCRRQNPDPERPGGIDLLVWLAFQAAAAGTTEYNSPAPVGRRTQLTYELDLLLDHWFAAQESDWASELLWQMVWKEPELAWPAIRAIARVAATAKARCDLGCGPLEDLIRQHPDNFIDRIEQAATSDPAFLEALSCVWLSLDDVPEPLARRYWEASGRQVRVLDAPEGWEGQGG